MCTGQLFEVSVQEDVGIAGPFCRLVARASFSAAVRPQMSSSQPSLLLIDSPQTRLALCRLLTTGCSVQRRHPRDPYIAHATAQILPRNEKPETTRSLPADWLEYLSESRAGARGISVWRLADGQSGSEVGSCKQGLTEQPLTSHIWAHVISL